MAATGPCADARAEIVSQITASGYAAVTDSRNARPLTIFVGLPSIRAVTSKVLDLTFPLHVLGAPPGNQDSLDWILTAVDVLIQNADLAITVGDPGFMSIGSQDLPSYDLTVRYGTLTKP